MEVRVNALQSLAYGLVPSVSAGTTGEEKERYNKIPGDSEEAKRTHIMNAIAKDSGTMEVFARAAKGLVIPFRVQ
ncbi:hypothetical protein LCGC14_2157980 [marine sediment metagenome]|uniref:Uncharacterized protein n=1 Tax=marine sediment metagenome TaxID=412755 RepID=A0A0F9G6F9_9ZZZZ